MRWAWARYWYRLQYLHCSSSSTAVQQAAATGVGSSCPWGLAAGPRPQLQLAFHVALRLLVCLSVACLLQTVQAIAVMSAYRDEWPVLIIAPSSLRGEGGREPRGHPCIAVCCLPVLPLLPLVATSCC